MVGQVVVAVETAAEGLAPPCRAYFLPILTHLLAVKGSSACHSLGLLPNFLQAAFTTLQPETRRGEAFLLHIQGHGDYTVLTFWAGVLTAGHDTAARSTTPPLSQ